MHHIDNSPDVLHGRVLQDAMAQIEDVTGTSGRAAEDILDAFLDFSLWRKEQCRIEIALHGDIMPEEPPAIIQGDAPVESDHVSAGALHKRQESCGVRSKMNYRHVLSPGSCQNPLRIGQDKTLVILRAERANPRVKNLHRLCTGANLRNQVFGEHLRESLHQSV